MVINSVVTIVYNLSKLTTDIKLQSKTVKIKKYAVKVYTKYCFSPKIHKIVTYPLIISVYVCYVIFILSLL